MRFFSISAPIFFLVWHFSLSVSNLILVFTAFNMKQDNIIAKAFTSFSIISVIAYAGVAAPLFVYSYKYGTSVRNRTGRFLSGVSIMFLLSSMPMMFTMLAIIISKMEIRYFNLFFFEFLLHIISFFCGLFVSWFAYMGAVAAAFHKWRGPERQILPYQGDGSGEISRLAGAEHLGLSFPDGHRGQFI